jgi:hypothetical protein
MRSRAFLLTLGLCLVLGVCPGWAADTDKQSQNQPEQKNDQSGKKDDRSANKQEEHPALATYTSPGNVLPPPALAGVHPFLNGTGPAPPAAPPPAFQSAVPPMMSDPVPTFGQMRASQHVQVSVTTPNAAGLGLLLPADLSALFRSPFFTGSAFKIGDNESPQPLDRVFLTFTYERNPLDTASPLGGTGGSALPAAAGLSNFGAPGGNSNVGPGSSTAIPILRQLATSSFAGQYSRYLQAALQSGNLILPNPDLKNGTAFVKGASGGNFLTPANRSLLGARMTDAQFNSLLSGILIASGVTNVPLTGLHVFNRPFNRSDAGTLITNPTNLYREVAGFEKTFLDGDASVGLRVPVFQLHGTADQGLDSIGDLTVVFKYALLKEDDGDLLSVGMAITAPTGPDVIPLSGPPIKQTLFQPFVGWITRWERFYCSNFSSVVIPTDMRDAAMMFGDLALGYYLYNNPASDVLNNVIPTLEAHLTTPLNHRGLLAGPVSALDALVLSGGFHLVRRSACVTLGGSLPVTGPHPVDFGFFAQLNVAF